MEFLSPEHSKLRDSGRISEEVGFKTPKEKKLLNRISASPDFTPYNFSSPVKSERRMNNYRGARNKRYFNMSDPGGNTGPNFNSPYYSHRRGNFQGRNSYGRGGHYRNRQHGNEAPISAYVDSSMTEDPWMELERELEKKEQSSQPLSPSDSKS